MKLFKYLSTILVALSIHSSIHAVDFTTYNPFTGKLDATLSSGTVNGIAVGATNFLRLDGSTPMEGNITGGDALTYGEFIIGSTPNGHTYLKPSTYNSVGFVNSSNIEKFIYNEFNDKLYGSADLDLTGYDATVSTLNYTTLNPPVDLTGYVPYTGASADVDIGTHSFTGGGIPASEYSIVIATYTGNGIDFNANAISTFTANSALQQAVDACPEGGIVGILPGTYTWLSSTTITTPNITIDFNNSVWTPDDNRPRVDDEYTNSFLAFKAKGIRVTELYLSGKDQSMVGIWSPTGEDADYWKVDNSIFYECGLNAVDNQIIKTYAGSDFGLLFNVSFIECGAGNVMRPNSSNCAYINITQESCYPGENVFTGARSVISNIVIKTSGGMAFSAGASDCVVNNVTIIDGIGTYGIGAYDNDNIFSNITMVNMAHFGIIIAANRCSVSNVHLENIGSGGNDSDGILIYYDDNNVSDVVCNGTIDRYVVGILNGGNDNTISNVNASNITGYTAYFNDANADQTTNQWINCLPATFRSQLLGSTTVYNDFGIQGNLTLGGTMYGTSPIEMGDDVDLNGNDLQKVTDIGTTGDNDLIQMSANMVTINGTADVDDFHFSGDATGGNDLTINGQMFSDSILTLHDATITGDVTATDARLSGNLQVNGGNIGVTADTDLVQIAANLATINGTAYVTGDVGIGVAAPLGDLHINDGANNDIIFQANNSALISTQTLTGVNSGGLRYDSVRTALNLDNGKKVNINYNTRDISTGEDFSIYEGGAAQTKVFTIEGASTHNATLAADLRVDGGDIGLTADTDLMQLAANVLTVNGHAEVGGSTGTSYEDDRIERGVTDGFLAISGSNAYNKGANILLNGESRTSYDGRMDFSTPKADASTNQTRLRITGDVDTAQVSVLASNFSVAGDTTLDGDLRVDGGDIGITADTDLMQLAANQLDINGAVNINSSEATPLAQLHVEKTSAGALSDCIVIKNDDAVDGSTAVGIGFIASGGTQQKGKIAFLRTSGNGVGDILFLQNAANNSTNAAITDEAMRITSDKNVNIAGDLRVDGGDIGLTADTDLIQIAANDVTVNGKMTMTKSTDYLEFDGDTTPVLSLYSTAGDAFTVDGSVRVRGAGGGSWLFAVAESSTTINKELLLEDKITTYNNVVTEGYGVPAIVDSVSLTGQSLGIGSTALTNTDAAGLYRISYYILAESIETGTETVACTFFWNDGTASRNKSSTAIAFVSGGYQQDVIYVMNGTGAALTYTVTLSEALEAATYGLNISVERLN